MFQQNKMEAVFEFIKQVIRESALEVCLENNSWKC
jgi:hypothetical protein